MISAKIISSATNAALVQLPGRHNPSVCVQGDTLATIAKAVNNVAVYMLNDKSCDETLVEWIVYSNNVLSELISEYNRVSQENGGFCELDVTPLLDI